MFTVEQINAAHGNVKSGADFPAYMQVLKGMGVTHYEVFVADGHAVYYGADGYQTASAAVHDVWAIAETADDGQFKLDLKAHQAGKTDYPTFCIDAAKSGIEKWAISMGEMTCTYCDKSGREILVEKIPQ